MLNLIILIKKHFLTVLFMLMQHWFRKKKFCKFNSNELHFSVRYIDKPTRKINWATSDKSYWVTLTWEMCRTVSNIGFRTEAITGSRQTTRHAQTSAIKLSSKRTPPTAGGRYTARTLLNFHAPDRTVIIFSKQGSTFPCRTMQGDISRRNTLKKKINKVFP